MIAVDSSALVAIVLGEPEGEAFVRALADRVSVVSAASVLEAAMVIEGRAGPDGGAALDRLIEGSSTTVVPVDIDIVEDARRAWRRFGKGRHPARLKFGDCLAYATAKSLQVPLLYKGDDFTKTDVSSALS